MFPSKSFKVLTIVSVAALSFGVYSAGAPWKGGLTQQDFIVHCGNRIALNNNIANQPIAGKQYAIPFIAKTSGEIQNLYWWARSTNKDSGYSKGTGGDIQITINEDALGIPGDEIGKYVEEFDLINNPLSGFRTTNLNGSVTKGEKYWIVFKNIHEDPKYNYLSLNGPLLRNNTEHGNFDTPDQIEDDTRAFHIARPCDDFYLYELTPGTDESWRPYQESNKPKFVVFPFAVVRVQNRAGETIDHGFPFTYGPYQLGTTNKELVDMPKVRGLNRVRQTATFERSDKFPIEDAELKFFAEEFRLEFSEVAVLVNGVFQGCVEVGEMDWYSVPLNMPIEANKKYEIEFLANSNANVGIMGGPMTGNTALDYVGNATISADGGKNWTGYPVVSHPNHQGVQLCFYIEGILP